MADGAAAITSEIWVTEAIDNRPDAGVDCSLALNSAGEPHALYWFDQESPTAKLIFAKRAKPEWLRETLPAKRGARTALIFDDQRQPWVAYYDLDKAGINVGFKDSTGVWRLDPVPDTLRGFAIGATDLVLKDGKPIVSYWSDAGLKIAFPTAPNFRPQVNAWRTEPVDARAAAGFHHSMALNAQGVPHITYFDQEARTLNLAVRAAGNPAVPSAWNTSLLERNAGEYSSLALHPLTGRLHVAYTSDAGLAHLEIGAGQPAAIIAGPEAAALYCSLGFDIQGRPHIAYYDSARGKLQIAHPAGPQFNVAPDPTNDTGGFASLAVVSGDVQQVASYNWTRRNLSFARIVAPPKAVIGPTPLQFIRQIGSVQITLDGSASLPEPEDLQFQWVLPQRVADQSAIPKGQNNKTLTIQYSGEPRKIDVQLVVKDSFGRQNVQTIGISVI